MARALVIAFAALLAVALVTVVVAASQHGGAGTSTGPGTGRTPPPAAALAGPYATRAAAEAYVRTHFLDGTAADNDTLGSNSTTWHQAGVLHLLGATPRGGATHCCDYYYFFVNGNLVGGQRVTSSIAQAVVDDATVSITYAVYRSGDPHCCPSGGRATVRFHWDGTRVVPLDPSPGIDS